MEIDFENYSAKVEMFAPGFVKGGMLCWVDFKKSSSDREKVERVVEQENEDSGRHNHYVVEFNIPVEITGVFSPK